jgi:hypothetical protein
VSDLGADLDALDDVDRAVERHRVDGGRGDLAAAGMPQRGDRAALVGQSEQDPSVEGPVCIGLPRLGEDRQGQPRRGRRLRGLFAHVTYSSGRSGQR